MASPARGGAVALNERTPGSFTSFPLSTLIKRPWIHYWIMFIIRPRYKWLKYKWNKLSYSKYEKIQRDFCDWFGRAENISFRPTVFYLSFSAEHVFSNCFIILYSSLFTFLAIKLPSIHYLICDQVAYCMFPF
jgi:hypothetical protein